MDKKQLLEKLSDADVRVGAFKIDGEEKVCYWQKDKTHLIKLGGSKEVLEVHGTPIDGSWLQDREVAAAIAIKNPLLVNAVPGALTQDVSWMLDVMEKASDDHRMAKAVETVCLKDPGGNFKSALLQDERFVMKAVEFSPFIVKDSVCKDKMKAFVKVMGYHSEQYGAGLGRLFAPGIADEFKKNVYELGSGDETKKTEEIRKAVEKTCAESLAKSFNKDFGKPKTKSKGIEI